jgi:guanine deaminase
MTAPDVLARSEPVALALRGTVLTPLLQGGVSFEQDGVVLVDERGRIRYVGSFARSPHRGVVRDVRPGLIIPGFVDSHTHFPQTRIIGRATGPLLDWLEGSVFPEEARFRTPSYAEPVAKELVGRLIRSGTTTAAIFSSSSARATEILFAHLAESGLRAMVGLTWMDQRCPKVLAVPRSQALRDSTRLVRKWHGFDRGRLRFAVTPRFALSCSRAMLRAAGDFARAHELPVQTHIAENRREGDETLRAHPYASSYLDVYDKAGLLGPRTVLAHAIHLSASEWKRIADAGAAIAHCPDSNFFLGSGRMRVARARARAITVGLGSDVAAGRSFSLRRAMASAYDSALALGTPLAPSEYFRMATLEGAKALGLGDAVGSLEAGKDADLSVVPMPRAMATLDDALAALVFDTDDVQMSQVYVRGVRLAPCAPR